MSLTIDRLQRGTPTPKPDTPDLGQSFQREVDRLRRENLADQQDVARENARISGEAGAEPRSIISMEPTRTVEDGHLWWRESYDVQTANVHNENGDLKYKVTVNAKDETVTVSDASDKMIVQFDEDGKETKGEAWQDSYNIDAELVRPDGLIDLIPWHTPGATELGSKTLTLGDSISIRVGRPDTFSSSGELNTVRIFGPLGPEYQNNYAQMFAVDDGHAQEYKGHNVPGAPNNIPTPLVPEDHLNEDFSDDGNVGYIVGKLDNY